MSRFLLTKKLREYCEYIDAEKEIFIFWVLKNNTKNVEKKLKNRSHKKIWSSYHGYPVCFSFLFNSLTCCSKNEIPSFYIRRAWRFYYCVATSKNPLFWDTFLFIRNGTVLLLRNENAIERWFEIKFFAFGAYKETLILMVNFFCSYHVS